MDFNRAEPTCYIFIFLTPVPANKMQLKLSYTILRLTYVRGLILKLGRIFRLSRLKPLAKSCCLLNIHIHGVEADSQNDNIHVHVVVTVG